MNFDERALSPLVFGAEIIFYFEKSPTPKSGANFLARFFTLRNFLKDYLGYRNFTLGKKWGSVTILPYFKAQGHTDMYLFFNTMRNLRKLICTKVNITNGSKLFFRKNDIYKTC